MPGRIVQTRFLLYKVALSLTERNSNGHFEGSHGVVTNPLRCYPQRISNVEQNSERIATHRRGDPPVTEGRAEYRLHIN